MRNILLRGSLTIWTRLKTAYSLSDAFFIMKRLFEIDRYDR